MKQDLHRLAGRIFNRPLCVTPLAAQAVVRAIGPRLGVNIEINAADLSALDDASHLYEGRAQGSDGYEIVDGVAVVPIMGELVNRGAWVGAQSGLVSYEGIQSSIRAIATDNRIKGVVLDVQSPGGEVAGMFETAALLSALARDKPVHAHSNDMACSAAYCLIAGATRIVAGQWSQTGSIGALIMHADISGQMEKEGVAVTLIQSGTEKTAGNPYQPLPEHVRADLQREVDNVASSFIDHVAKSRGLASQAVRATEARIYSGDDAAAVGLVDAVGPMDVVFESCAREAHKIVGRSIHAMRAAYNPDQSRDEDGQWGDGGGDYDDDPEDDDIPPSDLQNGEMSDDEVLQHTIDDVDRLDAPDDEKEWLKDGYRKYGPGWDPGHDDEYPGEGNWKPSGRAANRKESPMAFDRGRYAKLSQKKRVRRAGEVPDLPPMPDDEWEEDEDPNAPIEAAAEEDEQSDHPDDGEIGKPTRTPGDDDPFDPYGKKAAARERGRIKAILSSSAAAGRRELAEYFAFETGASSQKAIAALEHAPLGSRTAAGLRGANVPSVGAAANSDADKGRELGQRFAAMRGMKNARQ